MRCKKLRHVKSFFEVVRIVLFYPGFPDHITMGSGNPGYMFAPEYRRQVIFSAHVSTNSGSSHLKVSAGSRYLISRTHSI